MWQGISNQLSEQLGYSFNITEKEVLTGSEVNQCYCISDGNERFFLKLNTRDNLVIFETEAESLRILNEACCVQVPQFVHMGTCKDKAFLVLNYLPTKPLDSHSAYELGQNLASQHLWGEQIEYGFDFDNYIGLTPQPNKWRRKWCRFFAEQRIAWQLQLCEEKDISFGNIDTITSNVIQCLLNHQPKPSLLHGDLCYANSALMVSVPIILTLQHTGVIENVISLQLNFLHNFRQSFTKVITVFTLLMRTTSSEKSSINCTIFLTKVIYLVIAT